jgi:hypothetical protein
MFLTLSAKIQADIAGVYSDVTLQADAAGNLYTNTAKLIDSEQDFNVYITYSLDKNGNPDFTGVQPINLAKNNLYEDLTQQYPNRWKLDSFGNITISCEAFDDNHFKPTGIKIGAGVYANIYYSTATYN